MAQLDFQKIKVNKDGVFYLEGTDLGKSPAVVITQPTKGCRQIVKEVIRLEATRYEVRCDLSYAFEKVSGSVWPSAEAAAKSGSIAGIWFWLSSLWERFRPKTLKGSIAYTLAGVFVAFTVAVAMEAAGIKQENLMQQAAVATADTIKKSASTEGRRQVMNSHWFYESDAAKRYKTETGISMADAYTRCAPDLLALKKPIRARTFEGAKAACKAEGGRLPESAELAGFKSDKTLTTRLTWPKYGEWTATSRGMFSDDWEVYVNARNIDVYNKVLAKIEAAEDEALDELGKGYGDAGARGEMDDDDYQEHLETLLRDQLSIRTDAEIEDGRLYLDDGLKSRFRCVRDVPADKPVEVANAD